jgi:D-glycero-D-manno-heptose 1,7-bisphosphate phosphatase
MAAGYKLFVVSNQPNVAKGKSTLEELRQVHEKLARVLRESGIRVTEFYYCYHHPDSTSEPFGGRCNCRKPSPYFLHKAETGYRIDLEHSWMVGDRATDVVCGISAGARTIRLFPDHPSQQDVRTEPPTPDYYAIDLMDAVHLIIQTSEAGAVDEQ